MVDVTIVVDRRDVAAVVAVSSPDDLTAGPVVANPACGRLEPCHPFSQIFSSVALFIR
jgi:hypothetical protein